MRRLDTLEALRGIAALLVVMYHVQDIFATRADTIAFNGLFGAGDRGVDLFFVLSGFIITTIHSSDIGQPSHAIPYLYKRACRIFPSVWILTTLALATYSLHLGGLDKAAKLEPWNVIASLMLLPQTQPALVNVTWTLTYEIFFYLLFAILIVERRGGFVLFTAWYGMLILSNLGLLHPEDWLARYYLRPVCLEFGIGMICGLLVRQRHAGILTQRWFQLSLLVASIAIIIGGLIYEGLHQHALEPIRVVLYGVCPGALIFALATLEHDTRLRVPAPFVWLGSISYALYLVNFSVITLACTFFLRLIPALPMVGAQLGCIMLSIAAAGAFHTWVDRPIQQRLRRLGRSLLERPRTAPAHGAGA
jgi:exopolysaccharide production protein ExoZ